MFSFCHVNVMLLSLQGHLDSRGCDAKEAEEQTQVRFTALRQNEPSIALHCNVSLFLTPLLQQVGFQFACLKDVNFLLYSAEYLLLQKAHVCQTLTCRNVSRNLALNGKFQETNQKCVKLHTKVLTPTTKQLIRYLDTFAKLASIFPTTITCLLRNVPHHVALMSTSNI